MWQDQYTAGMAVEVNISGAWVRGTVVPGFVPAPGFPVWVDIAGWPAAAAISDENDIRPAGAPPAGPLAPSDRVRMRATAKGVSMKWDGEVLALSSDGMKAQIRLDGVRAIPVWVPVDDVQKL